MGRSTESKAQGRIRSVASAERTLAILDAFVGTDRPLTLAELQKATGLFKSVVFRYMISLERLNYIAKLHDGRYRLGPKVLELGYIYEKSFDILSIVNPAIDRIAEETGETVSFYVKDDIHRVCIARRESNHSLKVTIHPGSTRLVDDTSTGQVLSHFSEMNAEELSGVELIRETSGVGDPYTCSISIPIFGASGRFKGALTVSGPIGRFDTHDLQLRERLKIAAAELSFKLGQRAVRRTG